MNYLNHIDITETYAILGLSEQASPNDIKTAYKKLSLLCHPDAGGTNHLFLILQTAKDVLLNKKSTPHQSQQENGSQKRQTANKDKQMSWQDIIFQKDFYISLETLVDIMRKDEKQIVYYQNYKLYITPEDIMRYGIRCKGTIQGKLFCYSNPFFWKLKIKPKVIHECNIDIVNSRYSANDLLTEVYFNLSSDSPYGVLKLYIANKIFTIHFYAGKYCATKIQKKTVIFSSPNKVVYYIAIKSYRSDGGKT